MIRRSSDGGGASASRRANALREGTEFGDRTREDCRVRERAEREPRGCGRLTVPETVAERRARLDKAVAEEEATVVKAGVGVPVPIQKGN